MRAANTSICVQVVRDLISRALVGPLLPAQQQTILALLEQDPKLVHHIGLTPEQLPALVEHTPVLAYEVLLCLLPSKKIHAYFQVWCNRSCSKCSAPDCMHRLASHTRSLVSSNSCNRLHH